MLWKHSIKRTTWALGGRWLRLFDEGPPPPPPKPSAGLGNGGLGGCGDGGLGGGGEGGLGGGGEGGLGGGGDGGEGCVGGAGGTGGCGGASSRVQSLAPSKPRPVAQWERAESAKSPYRKRKGGLLGDTLA
jgi:hypothetical protein